MARRAARLTRIARVAFLRPGLCLRSPRARASVPSFFEWLERPLLRHATRRALRGANAARRWIVEPPLWARRILKLASAPPLVGGAYLLAVSVHASLGPLGADVEAALGGTENRIASTIAAHHAADVAEISTAIAVCALVLGATGGAVAGSVVRFVTRGRASRWVETIATLTVLLCLHAATLGRSIALYPALYGSLFGRIGRLQDLERLVTRLGPVTSSAIPLVAAAAVLSPLGMWCASRTGAPRQRPKGAILVPAALGLLALSLLMTGALPRLTRVRAVARGATGDARPNILVLAADSLRDDFLTPEVMPTLAGLAGRGTRFARQYTSLARTMPSWVTLLTGQYAHHHGVRTSYPPSAEFMRAFESVPRQLARAGYATAVVSDYGGDVFGQVNLGFAARDAPELTVRSYISTSLLTRAYPLMPFFQTRGGRAVFPSMREAREGTSADLLADDAIARLHTLEADPFFLVVFFSTTHDPFAPPYPYYGRYADPAYEGRCKYARPLSLVPDNADVAQLRALYRGAAASVDDAAGRVLREVDDLGLTESTIVVVTSDHGENLFERGRFGHGSDLFGDHQGHVPLAIVDPRAPVSLHRTVQALSRDVDLAPTLYELAGLHPAPGVAMDGVSLVPEMQGAVVSRPPVFAETGLWGAPNLRPSAPAAIAYPGLLETAEIDEDHGGVLVLLPEMQVRATFAKHRMIFDGTWKLIYAPTPAGPQYLLYDAQNDPEDRHDVAAELPAVVDRLRAALWKWMLEDPGMEERHGFLAPRGVRVPEVDDTAGGR